MKCLLLLSNEATDVFYCCITTNDKELAYMNKCRTTNMTGDFVQNRKIQNAVHNSLFSRYMPIKLILDFFDMLN